MKALIFCLFLMASLSACFESDLASTTKKPKGFVNEVSSLDVSDSILSWASITAKGEGLNILKNNFPNKKLSNNDDWLIVPKLIYFAEVEGDPKWFFVFESSEHYYIHMVVDQYKQITGLDADFNSKR